MWRKARMSDASPRRVVLPAPIVPVMISNDSVTSPFAIQSCHGFRVGAMRVTLKLTHHPRFAPAPDSLDRLAKSRETRPGRVRFAEVEALRRPESRCQFEPAAALAHGRGEKSPDGARRRWAITNPAILHFRPRCSPPPSFR